MATIGLALVVTGLAVIGVAAIVMIAHIIRDLFHMGWRREAFMVVGGALFISGLLVMGLSK